MWRALCAGVYVGVAVDKKYVKPPASAMQTLEWPLRSTAFFIVHLLTQNQRYCLHWPRINQMVTFFVPPCMVVEVW